MQDYRHLIQEVNGAFIWSTRAYLENRTEYVKPGNDGIKSTILRADEMFERDGICPC
jgi:hypothetical protein